MKYNLYWGDIHNHNSMGYAKGSMERSIDIAKNSLDFYAFTGHSQWHDMQEYESNVHMHWVNGFKTMSDNWDRVRNLIAEANKPGEFVAFMGYEWHSSVYGDYCLIYPDDNGKLEISDSIISLQNYARKTGAILIPHHIGYKREHRGFNIDVFDESVSPLIEIHSEHGCCETDSGPFEMITHSMGGRSTQNTIQRVLAAGKRFGFTASSDDHLGYPGAYGEGLTAVYSESLDRKSIWNALWNRRTYAVTGDRIGLEFFINGQIMGSLIEYTPEREIKVCVDAWDEIRIIEVIKNNQVIYRYFPQTEGVQSISGKRIKTRVDYGWGPWNDLSIPRICDWDFSLKLHRAELAGYCPCFQSGPFDENRRNKIISFDKQKCDWISYTSRKDAFLKRPINSVAFDIECGSESLIELVVNKPVEMRIQVPIEKLMTESIIEFTGPFPKESVLIRRAVPMNLFKADFTVIDKSKEANKEDFYYIRVTQNNGQIAWSSPIWVSSR